MASSRPAVTFDLWHTLFHLEPSDQELYMHRQIEGATDVLEGSERVAGSLRWERSDLRAAFEREYVAAASASVDGRSVTPSEQLIRASRVLGCIPRPEAYVAALERTLAETPFRLAPGALAVVRELAERGYAVGIISNTVGEPGRLLRPILRRFGFDDYIGVYVFSDEHPWTKPSPEIFRAALRALGSKPSAALHVGDGWADIEGARRAGLVGGVLFTGLQEYGDRYRQLFASAGAVTPDPELQVTTLSEVIPLAERLLPVAHGAPGGTRV